MASAAPKSKDIPPHPMFGFVVPTHTRPDPVQSHLSPGSDVADDVTTWPWKGSCTTSMPAPMPSGPEPAELFPTPGAVPNAPIPDPLKHPVAQPDVIDPGVGSLGISGKEPTVSDVPGSPMVT